MEAWIYLFYIIQIVNKEDKKKFKWSFAVLGILGYTEYVAKI